MYNLCCKCATLSDPVSLVARPDGYKYDSLRCCSDLALWSIYTVLCGQKHCGHMKSYLNFVPQLNLIYV